MKHLSKKYFVLILLGGSLLVRLLLSCAYQGFPNDIACFRFWSDRMYELGPAGFYSADVFTDYPPGYMYFLYIIGALRDFFNLSYTSPIYLILLKLPAILCDMACCLLLYTKARKRFSPKQTALLVAAYALNPAILLNSSLWGQVDSVYTLCIVCMCLFLMERKLFLSYLAFGIGILIKPQALVFTPVLLFGFLEQVIFHDFEVKKLIKNI